MNCSLLQRFVLVEQVPYTKATRSTGTLRSTNHLAIHLFVQLVVNDHVGCVLEVESATVRFGVY